MIYEEILLYHYEDFRKSYVEKITKNESVINHILVGSSAQMVIVKILILLDRSGSR